MSGKPPSVDTNVLVYAALENDRRSEPARALLATGVIFSVQALHEFVSAACELRREWSEIREALAFLEAICSTPAPITLATHRRGLEIAQRFRYHIFDALMIAAALQASSETLYSEDMPDGQKVGELTIRNPFSQASSSGATRRLNGGLGIIG
jgi:predicted nucleic acid-binding protein